MEPEPFVDDEMEPDPDLKRVTNAIIGAAIEVHRRLGPGYSEITYKNALELEFKHRGVLYSREHHIYVMYRDQIVGEGWLDFLVENAVIVEIKVAESIGPIHVAQVISYLRATRFKLALIINFNVRLLKDGIKRVSL